MGYGVHANKEKEIKVSVSLEKIRHAKISSSFRVVQVLRVSEIVCYIKTMLHHFFPLLFENPTCLWQCVNIWTYRSASKVHGIIFKQQLWFLTYIYCVKICHISPLRACCGIINGGKTVFFITKMIVSPVYLSLWQHRLQNVVFIMFNGIPRWGFTFLFVATYQTKKSIWQYHALNIHSFL